MIHVLAEVGFDGDLVVEHEAHVFVDKRGPAAVLADGHAFAEKLIHGTLPQPHLNSSTAQPAKWAAARAASTDHGDASAISSRAF